MAYLGIYQAVVYKPTVISGPGTANGGRNPGFLRQLAIQKWEAHTTHFLLRKAHSQVCVYTLFTTFTLGTCVEWKTHCLNLVAMGSFNQVYCHVHENFRNLTHFKGETFPARLRLRRPPPWLWGWRGFGVYFVCPLCSDCSFSLRLCWGRKEVEERKVIVRNRKDFLLDRSGHRLALCFLGLVAV